MSEASPFEGLRDLYNATVQDRARRPRHMRRLEVFDATAKGDNPMCGDRVQVWVKSDAGGTISNVGFEARGCEISVASADLMVEAVTGRSSGEVLRLSDGFAEMARTGRADACPECESLRPLASVHEYPSRVKCATLPWHALLAALHGEGLASSE